VTTRGSQRHAALLGLICLIFVVLATANAGGYRYGIGDQAFYEPATQLRLNPDLFPRDRALLESQARLTVIDETLAGATRLTGLDVPALFHALRDHARRGGRCGRQLLARARTSHRGR
jgi:hypothetical protein